MEEKKEDRLEIGSVILKKAKRKKSKNSL